MKRNTNVRRTLEEVSDWYLQHQKGATLKDLSKKYNTDCGYQFKKLGFEILETTSINRINKQHINYYFEKISNDFEAYVLGLIFADGSISKNSMKISLQKADEQLLLKIRDYIIPTQCLHNDKNSKCLIVNSKVLVENLKMYGITTVKTTDDFRIPNQIPQELLSSFIRGYFDGDGTVYYDGKYLKFNICSITDGILLDIQKEFSSNDIQSTMNLEIRSGKEMITPQGNTITTAKNMHRLFVRKRKDLIKLFDYLYNSSTIHLDRKYDKFKGYVNTEIS